MADSNSEPPRCPCGFYGNEKTLGLCSKCYREHQKKTNEADSSAPSPAAASMISAEALAQAMMAVKPIPSDNKDTESGTPSQKDSEDSEASKDSVSDNNGTAEQAEEEEAKPEAMVTDATQTEPPAKTDDKPVNGNGKRERCDTEGELDPDRPVQKNKKRCFVCNCRLELAIREIGKCRCEYVFCQLHRLPEQHDCIFDHKEKGRQAAREKMVSPKKHVGTSLKRIDSDS